MSDTQWPRFEVFLQEKPGKPHQNVGSVHAPDAEIALLNARDVFVRRPECSSLWVAPAAAILAKTAEEVASNPAWVDEGITPETPAETYYVFQKQTQRNVMTYVTHVGEVTAQSPQQALNKARAKFAGRNVFVWWVCPVRLITGSAPDEIDSLFAPARSKHYRQPAAYRTVTAIRQAKSKEENGK
jgi:ring-1,2-phenylacetyl-CoA epoxidase subunit PaaB